MNLIAKYGIIILLIIGTILLSISFINTRENGSSMRITERVIRVGRADNFPPFWYSNGNAQEDKGIDDDILKEIFKRLGITKVEYTIFPNFKALHDALQANQIDIAAGDLWTTPSRRRDFNFTIPYYYQGGIGMNFKKSRESEFKSAKDLKGKHIGVLVGVNGPEGWLPEYQYQSVSTYKTVGELIEAVAKGEIDASLEEYGAFISADSPNKKQTDIVLIQPTTASFVTHHSDTDFNHQLDSAIKSMWDDHSLYWIKSKYLPEYLIEPYNWREPTTNLSV